MKYLLSDDICHHCGGFGVFRITHPEYRVRVKFPKDVWEFLDETYTSIIDAESNAVRMKDKNNDLECEVITPTGEIISV